MSTGFAHPIISRMCIYVYVCIYIWFDIYIFKLFMHSLKLFLFIPYIIIYFVVYIIFNKSSVNQKNLELSILQVVMGVCLFGR